MARVPALGSVVVAALLVVRLHPRTVDDIGLFDDLGDQHVRPVLLNKWIQLEPELAHGPLGQGFQTHALLGPGDFLAVSSVGEIAELLGQLVDLLTNIVGGCQGLGALGLDGNALVGGLLDTCSRCRSGGTSLIPHMGGDGELGAAALLGPLGGGPLLTLPAGGCSQ